MNNESKFSYSESSNTEVHDMVSENKKYRCWYWWFVYLSTFSLLNFNFHTFNSITVTSLYIIKTYLIYNFKFQIVLHLTIVRVDFYFN